MIVTVSITTEDGKKKVSSDPISVRLISEEELKKMDDKTINELTDIFCSHIKNNFPNLLKRYQEKKNG